MDVNTGNNRFPSSSKGQTYFTPWQHVSEFTGNIRIKSIKQLTAKIRSDVEDFIGILKEIHEKSRAQRRTGVGIALTGLAVFAGALVIVGTGGLAAPVVVGAGAGIALGGAVVIGAGAALEYIDTRKKIKDVEMRWTQFVQVFLSEYVYYCDSEYTAKIILTHVKHVVYQEEKSYELFWLLFKNINPLVTNYYLSDSLCGYLEDATHLKQGYRPRGFTIIAALNSFTLFKILDLIILSFTLDQNSESAASKPLRNLTHFLDIVIEVVDKLPNYCDCSRYKVKLPLTYENFSQMYKTAFRLAEMCKSEAWETYRKEKSEAELQEMYEEQVAKQRKLEEKREAELQKMYEKQVAMQRELEKKREAELKKMYEKQVAKQRELKKKREAELQMYEEQVAKQRELKKKSEVELQMYEKQVAMQMELEKKREAELQMYEKQVAMQMELEKKREAELQKMYEEQVAKQRLTDAKDETQKMREVGLQQVYEEILDEIRIEVCARCHRPLK